jgi:hypothetical protein
MQLQSDSTQNNAGRCTSDRAKKREKKKNLIIYGIVIIIVALLIFLPAPDLPTPKMAMRMRCKALVGWYEHVNPYINKNNQKPLSLIEICRVEYKKDERPFPHAGLSNDQFPDKWTFDWGFLVNDPNQFRKEVPYDLFRGSDGWLIRELVPGKLYKKMLMVDQDGKIYELREIPKEKYKTL